MHTHQRMSYFSFRGHVLEAPVRSSTASRSASVVPHQEIRGHLYIFFTFFHATHTQFMAKNKVYLKTLYDAP